MHFSLKPRTDRPMHQIGLAIGVVEIKLLSRMSTFGQFRHFDLYELEKPFVYSLEV